MTYCKDQFSREFREDIDESRLCATSFESNIPGTCIGDSGSPLMKLNEVRGKYFFKSIVAFAPRYSNMCRQPIFSYHSGNGPFAQPFTV